MDFLKVVVRERRGWRRACTRVGAALLVACVPSVEAAGNLSVLNWSDYFIGPDAVTAFARAHDINVNYSILDTDDTLQAKLLTGHSGYDVVYPSSTYFAKQIQAGVYQELDWTKLPNRANLDPALMKKVSEQDPGNKFGVPYVWGTDGIILNYTKAKPLLGAAADLKSWDLLFRPEVVKKLHQCGVSLVDSASDVFPEVLAYMGRNPNSRNPDDYRAAFEVLRQVRPYIDQFSSTYINDVAGGDMCVAMGWSGEAGVIRRRVAQANGRDDIRYITPLGQTGLWFTMMGIPKDAPDRDNAYLWINHMLDPATAAGITNTIHYPTAVPAAKATVRPEILADASVFPPPEAVDRYFVFQPIDHQILRLMTRLWLEFKAGE